MVIYYVLVNSGAFEKTKNENKIKIVIVLLSIHTYNMCK